MAAVRGPFSLLTLLGVGLLALHLLGIQSTEAKSATGPRVLAMLNDKGQKKAFSQMFSGLESKLFVPFSWKGGSRYLDLDSYVILLYCAQSEDFQ